ncbi:transcription factor jumonji, jmjC [Parvularcula bermudensis HTCC2503]|uniref:Transcription factor jumonji, jmjC n=1 Tax=Parvularcula bermudensis (strain ATCC BAA-594 / HTCC2503 / KCTC 12087) TaxID=314260 RepID=E0TDB2_PARBH|nr:cupin-like domain-containing protein [Parvularcula bermudensis]ADM09935.1 transcription factor jumonji, jmjC [Parvularcula bermudensis HTCC2503]
MDSPDLDLLAAAYPDRHATFPVSLTHGALTRSALADLAEALPAELVEYNSGALPVAVDPQAVAPVPMTAREAIMAMDSHNLWMTLRNIERDATYRALLEETLAGFAAVAAPSTGPMMDRQGFVFLSSPGATTPFHIDEEHNVLIQIDGHKEMTIFSPADRAVVPQEALEDFHSGGHRNQPLPEALAARGETITLTPGQAVYVPPLAPHFVKVTGETPSLSLSVTWRSAASRRACYLHQINHTLRRYGARPRFPGVAPITDQLKIWGASATARLTGRW